MWSENNVIDVYDTFLKCLKCDSAWMRMCSSNKAVNIGDVFINRLFDEYPDEAQILKIEDEFYFPYYQVAKYIGKTQILLRAIEKNPFYNDDEKFRNFDNKTPFIQDSYIYLFDNLKPIYEFKARIYENKWMIRDVKSHLVWALYPLPGAYDREEETDDD